MLKRFLFALCIVVFHALLGTWPKADAQVQNGAPVQNGSVFNSEGPGPSTGPSAVIQGNDNPPNGSAAGAIQAIAADPSRPDTIYAGAVNGGIWKTTNGGTSWIPLIDQKASLSIASLAFDPTDPTHQTLIAGTGVTSNGAFASSSLFGKPATFGGLQNGLLYSRNGGTTWTRLGETTLNGQSVVDVAARGGHDPRSDLRAAHYKRAKNDFHRRALPKQQFRGDLHSGVGCARIRASAGARELACRRPEQSECLLCGPDGQQCQQPRIDRCVCQRERRRHLASSV